MRIGPIQLDAPLVLAPMAGITDRPFRTLCRRMGAGLAVSEMVSANLSLHGSRKSTKRLDFEGEPGPVAVQIMGGEPAAMAEAARIHQDLGAQIIDINMGCPVRKVLKVNGGSALLRDEALAGRIMAAVVGAVSVPVTLKVRTGWDTDSRNAVRIARLAEGVGVQAITVHGRTRACSYAQPSEYDTIRAVKQAVGIPVIANGDIDSPAKAREVLNYTGADAVMVGRGAQGRPWVFQEIGTYLRDGRCTAPPSPSAVWAVLREHLDELFGFYGDYQGVRIARKHIAWYTTGLEGAAEFRNRIQAVDSSKEQVDLTEAFFARFQVYEGIAA